MPKLTDDGLARVQYTEIWRWWTDRIRLSPTIRLAAGSLADSSGWCGACRQIIRVIGIRESQPLSLADFRLPSARASPQNSATGTRGQYVASTA